MLALGARPQRNLLATLILSQGTPMLAHGDEIGRTQHGNNNVYCQDSPLAWMDWSLAETNADLLAFTRSVIALRTEHPIFRRRRFLAAGPGDGAERGREIAWFAPSGAEMTTDDWHSGFGKSLAVLLDGDGIPEPGPRGERITDDSFLLCFNAHDEALDFVLPAPEFGAEWTLALDCSTPTGAADAVFAAATALPVPSRCLLVLRRTA